MTNLKERIKGVLDKDCEARQLDLQCNNWRKQGQMHQCWICHRNESLSYLLFNELAEEVREK